MRNTIVVFAISGLWHGANWTFICWGLYLALLFMPYLLLDIKTKYDSDVGSGHLFPTVNEICQIISTFFFIVIGWIMFRAESFSQALDYLYRIIANYSVERPVDGEAWLLLCFILLLIEWFQRDKQHALDITGLKMFSVYYVRWSLYVVLSFYIVYMAGGKSDFIYFQF